MEMEVKQAAPVSPAAPAQAPRVWLALLIVALYWAAFFLTNWLEIPIGIRFFSRLGTTALLILCFGVWWLFRRRTPFTEKLAGILFAVVGGLAVAQLGDPSLALPGRPSPYAVLGFLLGTVPIVLTAWALGLLITRSAAPAVRRLGLIVAISLGWGYFTLVRFDGTTGDLTSEMSWRWTPTAEELSLAEAAGRRPEARPVGAPALTLELGDWPGFRGPNRDGAVRGTRVAADWSTNPPRTVWHHRVGPAWSSVAVVGDRLFTQEQRGEKEAVTCYDAATGDPVWVHEDIARFWEAVSGAGPRATPTFAAGRVYTLGATGVLNCLDAATGSRHWSHDLTVDATAKPPVWGYSGSPLVVAGVVIAFAGGETDRQLLAYRTDTGELAWSAAVGPNSYSSPHPAVINGETQILMLTDRSLSAVDPATGAVRWQHSSPMQGAPISIQPDAVSGTRYLVPDLGLSLVEVTRDGSNWATARLWQSNGLKPNFNDVVIHDGHAYGFDNRIFGCIDLQTGKRRWKEGRYGHGQVLLLADQGLLLVMSESGEAVLLTASPERHEERGRFQAVHGKTWNHPVIAQGRLYVRNAEEMACYEVEGPRP
jgi:outer membrane protein assembly factor BamB